MWTCPAATSHKNRLKMHKSTVSTCTGKYDIQKDDSWKKRKKQSKPHIYWAFFPGYFPNYNAISKGLSKSKWAEEAEIRFWSWRNGEFLEQELGRRERYVGKEPEVYIRFSRVFGRRLNCTYAKVNSMRYTRE